MVTIASKPWSAKALQLIFASSSAVSPSPSCKSSAPQQVCCSGNDTLKQAAIKTLIAAFTVS
jgi:hypothetical protein